MRPIHVALTDKPRPVVVLTRERARTAMAKVTVANITSTGKGISTEVPVGRVNGLDHDCVVSCDNVMTIGVDQLGKHLGFLLDHQEPALAAALVQAFDLHVEDLP